MLLYIHCLLLFPLFIFGGGGGGGGGVCVWGGGVAPCFIVQ